MNKNNVALIAKAVRTADLDPWARRKAAFSLANALADANEDFDLHAFMLDCGDDPSEDLRKRA